jgi:voltage-gated potassium channel
MSDYRLENRFWFFKTGAYRVLQYIVLAGGLAAMTATTTSNINPELRSWLAISLWCCLGLFACDLLVKSWPLSGTAGASNYLFSAAGLIDALAILPIPLALLIGVSPDTAWLLASLWVLKLTIFVPGLSLLGRVISLEARLLASVLVIFVIVLLLAAVAMHVLERGNQPAQFGNLPLSLWWAVTTLTTTGYGDAVPQSLLGRMIAGVVMICGLGVFGLWTGILATGFATEYRRRDFVRNWDLVTRVPFLRNLDPPAVIALTRLLRRLELAERTIVVRRGRPGDCMYFVVSGEVEVEIEPQPVRLGPGSFFGEIALLEGGGTRMATVVTTAPSTLLILEVSDFRDFMAHHPELARIIEMESVRRASVIKGRSFDAHQSP